MTDFKPGDIVRDRGGDDYTVKVLAVHEESGRFWGVNINGHLPWSYKIEQFTKVEPFFEVGKKYLRNGVTFEPVRIDTQSGGERVAYGKVNCGDTGCSYWETRRIFRNWIEVE